MTCYRCFSWLCAIGFVIGLVSLTGSAQPVEDAAPADLAANPAVEAVPRPGDWWENRNRMLNELTQTAHPDIIFLGDSITQGWEGAGKDVWQEHYGDRNAINLGIGGDRTQHVLWRIENGNLEGYSPKAVVLMIGTNNLPDGRSMPEQTVEGVKAIVARLQGKLPDAKILLLGVFPRGAAADDPLRDRVATVNESISRLDNGQNVHYLDIGNVFLEDDGSLSKEIMPDALHPSTAGYERWAAAIDGKLDELTGAAGAVADVAVDAGGVAVDVSVSADVASPSDLGDAAAGDAAAIAPGDEEGADGDVAAADAGAADGGVEVSADAATGSAAAAAAAGCECRCRCCCRRCKKRVRRRCCRWIRRCR